MQATQSFSLTATQPGLQATYLGKSPINTDFDCFAIARSPAGTFFTIGNSSFLPFALKEFSATPGQPAVLVKSWGNLNDSNDRLRTKVNGTPAPLCQVGSLCWDDDYAGLWVSYGSFYATPELTPSFLCFVQPTASGLVFYGPWQCSPASLTGRTRGCVLKAPPALKAATGKSAIAYGARGPGGAFRSWGPGVVMFDLPDPLTTPANTLLPVTLVVDWPMKSKSVPTASGPKNYFFSDCPVGPRSSTYVLNNGDVQPDPAKPLYLLTAEDTVTVPETSYGMCVGTDGMFLLDDSIGYSYNLPVADAFAWYGNPLAHQDASPQGVAHHNNIDSVINPGHKIASVSNARGTHCERYEPYFASIPIADIITAYATGHTQAVPWKDWQAMTSFGGSVNYAKWENSQLTFDQASRTLNQLGHGGPAGPPAIHSWRIA